jgi:integrase
MDMNAIGPRDIVPVLIKINKYSNSLAEKNCELFNMIIRFAIQHGYRAPYTEINLTGLIPHEDGLPKTMPADVRVLFRSIETYPTEIMRFAMKMQFLTYLRSSETMGAEWSEFNMDEKIWLIPGPRMKTKQPHAVPLTTQMVSLLNELQLITGHTKYLYPSKHNSKNNVRDSLSNAFRNHGLVITPHMCRSVASTWQKRQSPAYSPYVVEAQLSHATKNKVQAAYEIDPHLMYMSERRVMLQDWNDYLYSVD